MFTVFAVGLGLTANLWAQVPSYVPTNGLVGYWPFNGNANDESGNGNNGTVNGATLTADRFGVANKAYSFDGVDDYIQCPQNNIPTTSNISISLWIKPFQNNGIAEIVCLGNSGSTSWGVLAGNDWNGSPYQTMNYGRGCSGSGTSNVAVAPFLNIWQNITYRSTGVNGVCDVYVNGSFIGQSMNGTMGNCSSSNLFFGVDIFGPNYINCELDDIGIWNRALSDCEIADLYNSQLGSFSNSSVSINPSLSSLGSNATLTVTTPLQNIQWQSNPGNMGWNNVVNNNTYSGSNNDTLVVSNLQLSNHNQPFRVLACGDTSNIATIQIADTCITNVTVYDTLFTTVTDTLIINTTLSLPAPNNENTILIYPNPASDHITIDNGNFAAMAGYSIKIENNAGQQVFQSAINQAQFYVDLSSWTGNGLYFVHLIDPQNNTVTVRKIVLQ